MHQRYPLPKVRILIIDNFMEVAINRILTNHQIPETLPGPAL